MKPSILRLATSFGVLAFGATLSTPSLALEISATAHWELDQVGGAGSPDIDGPAASGAVDVLGSDTDTTGNNIFYHTYGGDNGVFGSRSSGEGSYEVDGQYSFRETYTASGGAAAFSFEIIPGEIETSTSGSPLIGGDELFASYALEIFLNGSRIWNSAAEILEMSTGVNLDKTGTDIGGVQSGGRYAWGTYNETLDLGNFASGETLEISFDLTTDAYGILNNTAGCFGNGESEEDEGVAPLAVAATDEGSCGGSIARIGDPNSLTGGNTFVVTGVNPGTGAMPSPGGAALLVAGLAGLRLRRLRQAPSAAPR